MDRHREISLALETERKCSMLDVMVSSLGIIVRGAWSSEALSGHADLPVSFNNSKTVTCVSLY